MRIVATVGKRESRRSTSLGQNWEYAQKAAFERGNGKSPFEGAGRLFGEFRLEDGEREPHSGVHGVVM